MRFLPVLVTFTLATGVVINSGCKSSQPTVETVPTNPKPDWVTQRPIDAQYYIGVGIASKMIHRNDFQVVAKKNALEDMVGEINVKVSANSMLFSYEKGGRVGDEYKSFTKVTALEQVENFEVVDSWENNEEFWILYRLSKAQYQADKEKRIAIALEEAKAFAQIGVENEKNGAISKAFDGYFKALKSIEPYLSESLETNFQGEQVFFGAFIQQSIEELSQAIRIQPITSKLEVYWGQELSKNELSFELTHQGKAIQQIPVQFQFDFGRIRPKSMKTTSEGVAFTALDKVRKIDAIQEVRVKMDLPSFYAELVEKPSEMVTKILNSFAAPEAKLILSVRAPRVAIESNEKLYGKTHSSRIATVVREQLLQLGFDVTSSSQKTDFVVVIDADVVEGGKQYDMYRATVNGGLRVKNRQGETVYSESFDHLNGVQLDASKAGERAFEAASDEIGDVYLPRFKRFLLR